MVLPSAPVGAPLGVIPSAPVGAPVMGLPGQMPVSGMPQFVPGYAPGFPGTPGLIAVPGTPPMYHQSSQIPGQFCYDSIFRSY